MNKIKLSPNQKIVFISVGIVVLIFILWVFNFRSFVQRNFKKEDTLLQIFRQNLKDFIGLEKPKNNMKVMPPENENKIDSDNMTSEQIEILKQKILDKTK